MCTHVVLLLDVKWYKSNAKFPSHTVSTLDWPQRLCIQLLYFNVLCMHVSSVVAVVMGSIVISFHSRKETLLTEVSLLTALIFVWVCNISLGTVTLGCAF